MNVLIGLSAFCLIVLLIFIIVDAVIASQKLDEDLPIWHLWRF